jgi:hypothetical protein
MNPFIPIKFILSARRGQFSAAAQLSRSGKQNRARRSGADLMMRDYEFIIQALKTSDT